jgi:hypothetical protein
MVRSQKLRQLNIPYAIVEVIIEKMDTRIVIMIGLPELLYRLHID